MSTTSRMSEDFESMTLLDDMEYDGLRRKPGDTKPSKRSFVLVTALFLFFILDMATFIFTARLLLDARVLGDMDELEFRNPYIGLDELYGYRKIHPSHYDRLVNEPRFATQISEAAPDKVFPVDLHRWLSDFGLLSPPDRRFQVSSAIHTVSQFHILDYGMEQCALAVRLPKREEVLPHPYVLPTTEDTIPLDICELDVKRPLKEKKISWSNRPTCIKKLQVLNAKVGDEVETDPFYCKSGSFLGYQISCTAKSSRFCEIDVWSNQNATWGFYIKQYQTLL